MNDSNQYNNQNNNGVVSNEQIMTQQNVPVSNQTDSSNMMSQQVVNTAVDNENSTNDSNNTVVEVSTESSQVATADVTQQSPVNNQEGQKEEIVRETIPAVRPEDLYGYQPVKNEEVVPSVPPTVPSTVPIVGDNSGNQPTDTTPVVKDEKPKKKKNPLFVILFLIIIGLGGYIYYSQLQHQDEIARLKEECTPITTTGDTKELDLDSTIVQDLYNKVKTSIREDLANFELNDEMKLYLAYRQIPINKFYNSSCDNFNDTKMVSFTCKERIDFVPKAFKQDDLMLEVKELFGESIVISHDDIQLSNTCLGGYQYISSRGEYVEGECTSLSTTTFKATKELIKATSTESTIVLYEKVKYSGTEGKNPPEKLKSGTYKYTFKLDQNYNYIYISREYEI